MGLEERSSTTEIATSVGTHCANSGWSSTSSPAFRRSKRGLISSTGTRGTGTSSGGASGDGRRADYDDGISVRRNGGCAGSSVGSSPSGSTSSSTCSSSTYTRTWRRSGGGSRDSVCISYRDSFSGGSFYTGSNGTIDESAAVDGGSRTSTDGNDKAFLRRRGHTGKDKKGVWLGGCRRAARP